MIENQGKTILVSGATGRQGGSVVNHLLKNHFKVKALSRTPESVSSKLLKQRGVDVVRGDMADTSSLLNAMRGCDGVFSIQNYFECGGEKEVQFGKNMADAAKSASIAHFIYSSVCNADGRTGVPHFETKYSIEQHLSRLDLPATVIRPVKFMENYYIPQVFKGILSGKLYDPISAAKKHQMIATDDIGQLVANAFANPAHFLNKSIEVAGDELTNEQVAAVMTEVLGIHVKFKRLPMIIVKLVMDREMYRMFKWFNETGFTADTGKIAKDYPSVHLTSFREFLLRENWQRWNKKGSV